MFVLKFILSLLFNILGKILKVEIHCRQSVQSFLKSFSWKYAYYFISKATFFSVENMEVVLDLIEKPL